MHQLFFWKNWLKEYRIVWYLVGILCAIMLLFLWGSYFNGAGGTIQWLKIQEQSVIETTVHGFRLGPFELSIPGENYVVFEYFHGSDIKPNTTASYLFLFAIIFGAVLIVSVITTIDKFWFFVGMGLFILFVVSLRLEVLGIFGLYNRLPVIVTSLLFLLPAFYFNRINTLVPFFLRLILFTVIAAVLGVVITFYSGVAYPFYHLSLTTYVAGMVLTLVFIIMVAHDIPATFVNIVSQGSTKSLRHLSLICAVYMANLLITCFHEVGAIEWNFLYINLYLLLSIAAIAGIWGFRQREVLYGNIISFAPYGAYFFVAMALICFAMTGQLLANNNDPSLKVIRDAIIFSQTGYGIIFLTYVFSNFVLMLARDLPIHKVLYNPTRMPYFTYRFAGMIAMLGFVFYSNWRTYVFNAVAGFYNTAGDLYSLLDNDAYAESFYEQGHSQGFQNNRSNYALATRKSSRLNMEGAHENYRLANARRPTLFSLTNAGNIYLWEQDIFGAIQEYRHAIDQVAGSSILDNNLGFAYAKVHNLDSAIVYLNKAREDPFTKASAESNFFAMATMELIPMNIDSIINVFHSAGPAVLANALAMSTLQHQDFQVEIHPLAEEKLNIYSATLLNNYVIKYAATLDTGFVRNAYDLVSDSLNSDYNEAIKASLAHAYYLHGNVAKALEIMAELAYVSQSYQGKFNYIMGLWALEQHNPELASLYFTYANTYDYKDAVFYNAIALSEAGNISDALTAWRKIRVDGNDAQQEIAMQMEKVLQVPMGSSSLLSDAEKYQFTRYRISLADSMVMNRLIATFENDNYAAQALLDISRRYFEAGQYATASIYFSRIKNLELTDRALYLEIRYHELRLLAHSRNIGTLMQALNKELKFEEQHALDKLLYTSLIMESKGDTTNLSRNYEILGTYNPYHEEAVIAAAAYFRGQQGSGLKAYNLLAEAIQINSNSVSLLNAYINEAVSQGFDEYASSAYERLRELKGR